MRREYEGDVSMSRGRRSDEANLILLLITTTGTKIRQEVGMKDQKKKNYLTIFHVF